MKIGVDDGHTLNGYDTGAVGIANETDWNRAIGNSLRTKLKSLGHTVVNCTIDSGCSSINDSLRKRVSIANNSSLDVFISLHANASDSHKANGTEVWISGTGGKAERYAKSVCTILATLGYYNRGVKVGNLYVTKNTVAPAILVECGFIDNQRDVNLFNADKIADAICLGVIGQTSNATGGNSNTNTSTNTSKPNTGNIEGTGVYEWEDMPKANATVINDFFYCRDKFGNKVEGRRVDINDNICIVDLSYSKQLLEVFYPGVNQAVHAYIKNAANCIKYMYQDEYQNGSTSEPIY
ncbi:MAG: N-acetylmuramoyl-L-alanine amidase, partial [Sarcina sp.]